LVPEPFTLEPCESYSRSDLDEYATVLGHIADEARTDPETVRSAPHAAAIHRIQDGAIDDPARLAMTWRGYKKKQGVATTAAD
jgi:glycine dehydrogenase subunit 2